MFDKKVLHIQLLINVELNYLKQLNLKQTTLKIKKIFLMKYYEDTAYHINVKMVARFK